MKNIEVKEIRYWSALFGPSSESKNSRSHFKLILCCFLPNSCPHTKFHPNRTKNIEVKRFAIGRLWLVGPVSQKIAVVISNSFYVAFCPIVVHITNFIQIRLKTQKLKRFAIGWLCLVGLVGQKIAVVISNSFYVVFSPILAPKPNLIKIV